MTDLREAAKAALEALEQETSEKYCPAIPALRAALAEDALQRMADNERELGIDYTSPVTFAQMAHSDVAALQAEVERLTQALQYEQHRAERIGTHGWGCWSWGPQHYECALRKIRALQDDGK